MNASQSIGTKSLTTIAVMTTILCVLAPLSIPIGPIPISLATFVIYLSIFVLGQKKSTICVLLYLLLGFVGLPVFSGYSGGFAKLFGPTGGYLLAYPVLTLVSGYGIDRFRNKKAYSVLSLIIGTVLLYLIGTFVLSQVAHMDFSKAAALGIYPFLIGDLVKILIAVFIGDNLRQRLQNIHFGSNQ